MTRRRDLVVARCAKGRGASGTKGRPWCAVGLHGGMYEERHACDVVVQRFGVKAAMMVRIKYTYWLGGGARVFGPGTKFVRSLDIFSNFSNELRPYWCLEFNSDSGERIRVCHSD